MYHQLRVHQLVPLAYVDDTARPYAKQIAKTNIASIGSLIGRIRNIWHPAPPERIYKLMVYVCAADCLRRWIDRAGLVLDSSDIAMGLIQAIASWSIADMTSWMATNFVIIGVAVYLMWPVAKRLLATIHKWATER